jgi:phage gpG-like protein
MTTTVKLDTRELDRIMKNLSINRDQMIRKIAFEVEAQAKQNAPVDTSAMRNSIYTVTAQQDGYGAAMAAAKGQNPEVETTPHPKPKNGAAHVGPSVEYAAAVELGHLTKPFRKTYGAQRFVAAQPFLVPAVEQVGAKYNDGSKWQELVK